MNETLRLGKNSLWLLAARLGAQVLALFTLLLAHKLGSAGFGEYALFTAVIFIGNVVTTFGTDMLFIREIAARDDLTRLPAALWLQLLLSGLFIVVIMLLAPALPNQSTTAVAALRIYSLALIPLAFYNIFTTALRGRQHMDSYALLNFSAALLQATVVLVFVAFGKGVVTLAWLLLGSQCLLALFARWVCTRQVGEFWQDWRFSWTDIRVIAAASAPLGGLGILGMLYQKLGLVLLSTLGGASITGLFSAGLRVIEALKSAHQAAFTSLYPLMAQNGTGLSSKQTETAIRLSWKLLIAGAVVLALGLWLLAEPLVGLLYGTGFWATAPILRILAWILVPYTINSFLTLAFVVREREHAVGLALTVSLLGLGIMSIAWIPAYGLEGAAWAALGAESLQAAVLLFQTPEMQNFLIRRPVTRH